MQDQVPFSRAYAAAGGVRGSAPVSYPLTAESIRKMAVWRERILRIQFPGDRFSDADEAILADLSLDDPDQAFRRFEFLVGLWHAWERGIRSSPGSASHSGAASELILQRVPIRIRIAGRIVNITSRSRAALIRLAMHDNAIEILQDKLSWLTEQRVIITERRVRGDIRFWHALRLKRRIARLSDRCAKEWEYQWRGILANCLTPDGSAALPEQAPDWWNEVDHEDEHRLMLAIAQHIHRYLDAASQQKPAGSGPSKDDGRVGFGVFLRMLEGKLRLPPMALEDADLLQTIHAAELGMARGAAPTELEDAFMA